jgi:phosphate:Na+ symporter
MDLDFDASYEHRIKPLHSAIVEFATRAGEKRLPPEISERVYALRAVSGEIVQAVKSVKHLRKNVLRFTTRPQGVVTELYDGLRTEIARITVEIRKLGLAPPEDRSALWLDQERAQIEDAARRVNERVDALIRSGDLSPSAATSVLNDSVYAYGALRDLVEAARSYFVERDSAGAQVETLLSLDLEEMEDAHRTAGPALDARRGSGETKLS